MSDIQPGDSETKGVPPKYVPSWSIGAIDLSRVETARIRDNRRLFYLLNSASFIESGADLYTRNLIELFKDDAEVSVWLQQHWEIEELHHGRALRAYIEHVWPEFDWQAAFDDFFAEYSGYCRPDALAPTHVEELAARCVVEMGTSSLYRAIHECSDEPVLREISEYIRRDEIGHYKYFYRYFSQYRKRQEIGRSRVLRTLVRRLLELRSSDAECALRHVFRHRERGGGEAERRRINDEVNTMVRRNIPIESMVKMLIKPLELGPRAQRLLQPPLRAVTRAILHFPI